MLLFDRSMLILQFFDRYSILPDRLSSIPDQLCTIVDRSNKVSIDRTLDCSITCYLDRSDCLQIDYVLLLIGYARFSSAQLKTDRSLLSSSDRLLNISD